MARVTGVRLDSTGPVYYCLTADALAAGDAVEVETPTGRAQGRVVIAPEQVVLDDLPERPTAIARRLPPAPPAPAPTRVRAGRFGLAAALVAGVDPAALPPELVARAGVAARLAAGLSARNRAYLEKKLRLPALGAWVETPRGPGRVVEVKVLRELVTVALASGETVELFGPRLEEPPEGVRGGHLVRPGEQRGRRGRQPVVGPEE